MTYRELRQMLDGAHLWGQHSYEKSLYRDDLSDAAISVITEQMPGKNSPLSYIHFSRWTGLPGRE